jgi:hypothetical protein
MALVGEAHILVKAITTGVQKDIDDAFSGADSAGDKAGARAGRAFSRGFKNQSDGRILFGKFYDAKAMAGLDKTRQRFLDLNATAYLLSVGIVALSGVLGSLIGGLGVVAAVIAASVAPAFLGLIGILGTIVAIAGTLKAVFSGVGDALKAQGESAAGAAERAKALERATRDLEDANYNYNQTVKETEKRTKQAADAIENAADAEVDAKRAVEAAERNYQDSVAATQEALEDVTQAREDAKEAIQQLRFELEGGVISEKKARLEFEKARDSLQRVQDLPPNSRARREAELAFAEADLNLRRAIDKNGDLRKATAKANREGISGNKNVLAAEKDLVKARQNQSDAEVNAFKASKDLTKATNQLAEAIKYAEENGELFQKNLRDIELAQRAVDDATQGVTDAANSGGLSEYQKAMENLSPAAQDFVKAMEPIKAALTELRKSLQEEFFPGFTEAVTGLAEVYIPLLTPSLKNLARELGNVAKKFKDAFTTPEKQAEIKQIFDDFVIITANLGDAFIDLSSAFTTLQAAFSPYVVEFSEFVKKKAEAFKNSIEEKKANGELNETFKKGTDVLRDLSAAFGNAFSALTNFVSAATGPGSGGQIFLDWLKQTTADWEKFTEGGDENSGLVKTIADIATNATKVLDLFGDLILLLVKISASEGFGKFIDKLREAIPTIENIALKITDALPAFGDFIKSLVDFTNVVVDAAPIQLFFNILKGALDTLIFVLDNPVGKSFLAFSGLLLATSVGFNKVKGAVDFYKDSVKSAYSSVKDFAIALRNGEIAAKVKTAAKTALTVATKVYTVTVNVLTAALRILNKVFMQSPLGRIIFLVGLLVAGFVILYKNSETVREVVDAAFKKVKEAVETAFNWIKENWPLVLAILTGPIGLAVLAIVKNWDDIVAFVKGIPQKLKDGASKMWTWVTDYLSDSWKATKEKFDEIVGKVKELPGRIKDAASGLWDGIKDSFKSAINWIIEKWNNLSFELRFPDSVFGLPLGPLAGKGFTLNTPNIKPFAMGGTVYPRSGGTLGLIAEAGRPERIEPLDPDGLSKRDKAMISMLAGPAGGINITVNPSPGMDERELAALVSRQLAFQLRKGAA